MPRSLWVMIAASLGFGFVTATTFTSLGYVLYTMVADLGWSQAAAGSSFALLGLACGLASPLPPFLIKLVGSRLTLFIGAIVLAAGFLLASVVQGIGLFFVATALMGAGFSLIAPSPGVFLIATWLPERSARLLGVYFMAGSLGGVVGPLIVGAIVGLAGSWRLHWALMGMAAIALGLLFLVAVRDAVTVESADQVKHAASGQVAPSKASAWTVRQAMRSPAFLLIAAAMLVVQTVVTTLHSVLVSHVAGIGGGAGAAAAGALAMSLLALTGTLAKGATGALAEKYDARWLLILGLGLQFGAITLLATAQTPVLAILAALLFGIGWGLAWLSAHVLILRYFGAALAADLTAMATMATTLAVLGPLSAGWVADRTGGFAPIFLVFAGLLALVIASTTLFLRAPRALPHPDVAQSRDDDPLLVPAE
jgi:cyanate permease